MCSPIAAASALQIGSGVFSYVQQSQNARVQSAAYQRNLQGQLKGYDLQAGQVSAQAADEVSQRAREAMIERGRISAVIADSGLGGASSERELNQSRYAESADTATIRKNRDNTLAQIGQDIIGAGNTASSRIASITRPSLLGTGLQIAGGVMEQQNKNATRSSRTS